MAEDVGWTLLVAYLFGECSEEEEARVQRWIRRDPKRKILLGQLHKVLQETEDAPSAEELDAEALWDRIDRETREEPETEGQPGPEAPPSGGSGPKCPGRSRSAPHPESRDTSLQKAVWTGAVAALVAVTGVLWLFVPLGSGPQGSSDSSPETFATQKGQRTAVRLPDGSQVRLNVDSRLTVPPSFGEENRVVRLEGEAFFEVREDSTRPFIVRSKGVVTRVVGTTFDVGAYPEDDEVKVVVAEGRVALHAEESSNSRDAGRQKEDKNVILTRNQVSLIPRNGERIIRREDDVGEHLAWIDGQLAFEDAPFAEVVRRLERWYDLEITMEAGRPPPSGHLNAQFDKDRSIADVMRVIGAAFGLKHEREGNRVTFSTAR